MMTSSERERAMRVAQDVAIEAGDLLRRYEKKINSLHVRRKDALGVVSDADLASESRIIRRLKGAFPSIDFLSEEESYSNGQTLSSKRFRHERCWVIDPLDGTHNFLAGLPYYAVCIALLEEGRPVLGVVYRPSTGDCFHAIADKGSFLNRRRLKAFLNTKPIEESMLVTGFSSEKGRIVEKEFRTFKNVVSCARGVRRMGSAALDICHVAQGVFDGFWEVDLAPWDVSAAALIALEAQVHVTDYHGRPFDPFAKEILVARSPFHRVLRDVIT